MLESLEVETSCSVECLCWTECPNFIAFYALRLCSKLSSFGSRLVNCNVGHAPCFPCSCPAGDSDGAVKLWDIICYRGRRGGKPSSR